MLHDKFIALLFLLLAAISGKYGDSIFCGRLYSLLIKDGRYFDILFGINHENQEVKGVWEKK
ncbi:MAG: hypothetical protein ISR61_05345 [Desulfobacteraceae bacterium]|nr:hypothetical protein [Desulfobacteraceae bacterium]